MAIGKVIVFIVSSDFAATVFDEDKACAPYPRIKFCEPILNAHCNYHFC